MEGISDGRAVDSCFYCALLYPDLEPCPLCKNRLRYQSARMWDAPRSERAFADAVARYRSLPCAETATNLLILWHDLGDEATLLAAATGIRAKDLLRHFPGSKSQEPEHE